MIVINNNMTPKIPSIYAISDQLTGLVTPAIGAVLVVAIGLLLKDFAMKMAKGWAFKFSKAFNEGEQVILDGEEAVIVKIGLTETIFGIYSERGYTWRYVPNERIVFLRLEKIINKDLHPDSDFDKAKKLKKLLNTVDE